MRSYEQWRLLEESGSEPIRKIPGISTFNEMEDYKENWRGARKVSENHQHCVISRDPKVENFEEEGVVDMLDYSDSAHCVQQLIAGDLGMQETETMPELYEEGNSDHVELSFSSVSYERKKEVTMVPREEHRVIKRI